MIKSTYNYKFWINFFKFMLYYTHLFVIEICSFIRKIILIKEYTTIKIANLPKIKSEKQINKIK